MSDHLRRTSRPLDIRLGTPLHTNRSASEGDRPCCARPEHHVAKIIVTYAAPMPEGRAPGYDAAHDIAYAYSRFQWTPIDAETRGVFTAPGRAVFLWPDGRTYFDPVKVVGNPWPWEVDGTEPPSWFFPILDLPNPKPR